MTDYFVSEEAFEGLQSTLEDTLCQLDMLTSFLSSVSDLCAFQENPKTHPIAGLCTMLERLRNDQDKALEHFRAGTSKTRLREALAEFPEVSEALKSGAYPRLRDPVPAEQKAPSEQDSRTA